jgi:hypothetical protein
MRLDLASQVQPHAPAGRWRGAERAPTLLAAVKRVATISEGPSPLADVTPAWYTLSS